MPNYRSINGRDQLQMTEFPVKVFIRMISNRIVTKLWKLIDVMSQEFSEFSEPHDSDILYSDVQGMICHEHHSVILRLWIDKDLQKK